MYNADDDAQMMMMKAASGAAVAVWAGAVEKSVRNDLGVGNKELLGCWARTLKKEERVWKFDDR